MMVYAVPDPSAKFGTQLWQGTGEYVEGTPVVEMVAKDTRECEGCDHQGTVYAIAGRRAMWTCRRCTKASDWVHSLTEGTGLLAGHEVEPADVEAPEELRETPEHETLNGTNLTDLDAAERALSYLREPYNAGELERFEDPDSPALRITSRSSGFQNFHLFRDTPALKVTEPRSIEVDGENRLRLTIRERADDSEVSAR